MVMRCHADPAGGSTGALDEKKEDRAPLIPGYLPAAVEWPWDQVLPGNCIKAWLWCRYARVFGAWEPGYADPDSCFMVVNVG